MAKGVDANVLSVDVAAKSMSVLGPDGSPIISTSVTGGILECAGPAGPGHSPFQANSMPSHISPLVSSVCAAPSLANCALLLYGGEGSGRETALLSAGGQGNTAMTAVIASLSESMSMYVSAALIVHELLIDLLLPNGDGCLEPESTGGDNVCKVHCLASSTPHPRDAEAR